LQKFIVSKEIIRIFAAQLGLKPMNSIVNSIASEYLRTDLPAFKAGDRVTVHYKIKEGAKERIQLFQGDVLQRRNGGIDENQSTICSTRRFCAHETVPADHDTFS
jgi:ribosomal protein L19